MNPAVQKTLSLILLIFIGGLLKQKIVGKEQLGGVKVLILSIALPATIFVALLKTEVELALLSLPLLALAFNLLLLVAARYTLPLFRIPSKSADGRTLLMLLPSLAPGLSCFPFVAEYLGEEALAFAALADVGNKIFVLIILYLLAMHWYYKVQGSSGESNKGKLKGLLLSLVKEPVNLVIVLAIVMLAFGWNIASLPLFLQDAVLRMSALMTPMVLLFIGMAVKTNWKEFRLIFSLLLWRSGAAFCLSAIFLFILPQLAPAAALVAVAFPQSATSFWPFAHMSSVAGLEQLSAKGKARTFNLDLALNVLACSLPFSTVLILTICSVGNFFTNPVYLLGIGGTLLAFGLLPKLFSRRQAVAKKEAPVVVTVQQLAEVGEE